VQVDGGKISSHEVKEGPKQLTQTWWETRTERSSSVFSWRSYWSMSANTWTVELLPSTRLEQLTDTTREIH
jgi:hypothetical protein